LQRRVLGRDPPHWFKDAAGLVSYVNMLALLPTFAAIALEPEHFFRRLPQYIRSKKSWVKTPLKFLTSCLAFIAGVLFFLAKDEFIANDITERSIYWSAVVMAASAPILLPVTCIVLLAFYHLARFLPDLAPEWLYWELQIPLVPSTYTRLDISRFGWGSLYFGVFFYVGMQTLAVLGLLELWLFGVWVSQHSLLFAIPLAAGLAGVFLFAACCLIMRPYIALLREAVIIPTKDMHRSDGHLLKQAIEGCTFYATSKQWRELDEYLPSLSWLVRMYEADLAEQGRRVKSAPVRYQQKLVNERAAVFGRMFSTAGLRVALRSENMEADTLTELNSLLDRIDLLADGQRHVADMKPDEPNELELL
jgi:hypothetical protein